MDTLYNITMLFVSYRLSISTKEQLCTHFICIDSNTKETHVFELTNRMHIIENFKHYDTYNWWVNETFLPRLNDKTDLFEYIEQEVYQQSNTVQLHISHRISYTNDKSFYEVVNKIFNDEINTNKI